MNEDELYLITPASLHLVNGFLKQAQKKCHQEFNLSLRSMDPDKSIGLGSVEHRGTYPFELRSRPPNLISISLNVSLSDQYICLFIHLSSNEILRCSIQPPPGLKLHNHKIGMSKYSRLDNRLLYSDIITVKPEVIMIFDKTSGVQQVFSMSYNLLNDISYISKKRPQLLHCDSNNQENIVNNILLDDLIPDKQQGLSFPTISFTPVLPPPKSTFKNPHPSFSHPQHKIPYLPEVRFRSSPSQPVRSTSTTNPIISSATNSSLPRQQLQSSPSHLQHNLQGTVHLPTGATSLDPYYLESQSQRSSVSRSTTPTSQSGKLRPAELERLAIIQREIQPDNTHVQSFFHDIKKHMSPYNLQEYVFKSLPFLVFEIIKDKIRNSSTPEIQKFALRFLEFLQFKSNSFLSDQDCCICWIALEDKRLLEAHWDQTHSQLPLNANLAQKQFLLNCFHMDIMENHLHKDVLIQNMFRPVDDQEYILFERLVPTFTKLSTMLQIYLNSDHTRKLDFLAQLFQPPIPSHADSLLFLDDPFPSTRQPTRTESIESLMTDTDQMNLTLPNEQSTPLLDYIDAQPSAPHGLTYPHHQDTVLTEGKNDSKINQTV